MYDFDSWPIPASYDSPNASHLAHSEHLAANVLETLPLFFDEAEFTNWAW